MTFTQLVGQGSRNISRKSSELAKHYTEFVLLSNETKIDLLNLAYKS